MEPGDIAPVSWASAIWAMISSSVRGAVSMIRAPGGAAPENLAWHEGAGVEAYRTALDQPQSANGDQIGRTGAGADQMDGHRRATSR